MSEPKTGATSFIDVSPGDCDVDPKERLRHEGTEAYQRLHKSIDQSGVLQPPGVVRSGDRFRVIWGNGRVISAQSLRHATMTVALLGTLMTEQEFLIAKGIENTVRNDWTMPQLTDYLAELAGTGMSQKEISDRLSLDAGLVSSHLTLARSGIPALIEAYRGGLEFRKAVYIARQDAQEQHRLLAEARDCTCDGLVKKHRNRAAQGKQTATATAARLKIHPSSAVVVTFTGKEPISVASALQASIDTTRLLEKALKDGLSASTVAKTSSERAKALLKKQAEKAELTIYRPVSQTIEEK